MRYEILVYTIKQGDSDREVIICFGTKFRLSVDLTDIESDLSIYGLPYVTVINNLWNSTLTGRKVDILICSLFR